MTYTPQVTFQNSGSSKNSLKTWNSRYSRSSNTASMLSVDRFHILELFVDLLDLSFVFVGHCFR